MAATDTTPLLRLDQVSIGFRSRGRQVAVTQQVSFDVHRGERVGLVGESGCGKSVTGLAILRLLPAAVGSVEGRILFEGRDLAALPERRMRALRGREIAMIFQEPMSALDPVFTVGQQIGEAWRAHFPGTAAEARERTVEMLARVGIALPARRHDDYPHQLSGGMRQRVMIAMALICEPKLLICDEPTTALDVTVQAQIIRLLRDISDRTGCALLFITHDLGVVAETCSRLLTMYAGEVVEDAPVDEALRRPRHPYTSGLLRSLPRLAERRSRLGSIPGRVPSPAAMPSGCRFRERCVHADDAGCAREQPMRRVAGRDAVANPETGDSFREVRCCRSEALLLPGALA